MRFMRIIRAPNISRAHELVIKMILEKGYPVVTEDQEATIEFEEVAMKIDNPLTEPLVSPASRLQQRVHGTIRTRSYQGVWFRV